MPLNTSCIACGYPKTDKAHIKSKGAGGTMSKNNLIPLCRDCHIIQHRIGWFRFANRYPTVMDQLISKGWKFIEEFGVIKLRNEDVDSTV